MYIVETKDLSYHFSSDEKVLDNLNIQVPTGSIYGFLGPNGAGKTTTLKLILGLLKMQTGKIELFGQPFPEKRIEALQQIGSLIESPSLYGHLTARENLRIWQKLFHCSKERIEEVLEIVGLTQTGSKKAGKFSLGMKQRLSIAIALLHEPKLLILDEPTNGLDPNGILEIRELLIRINKEHKTTIVISSHLLAEIEKLVTHVGIIHRGQLKFQGTMQELQVMQTRGSFISWETNNPVLSSEIMVETGSKPVQEGNWVHIPSLEKAAVAQLNQKLVEKGIEVYQIVPKKNDLETIFMDITKN